MLILSSDDVRRAEDEGLLVAFGEGNAVEPLVTICHATREGDQLPVYLSGNCYLRSGTVLYSGVELGYGTQTGHNAFIRENTTVGHHSIIGTGAVVEFGTTVGNHTVIQSQAHITALATVEDYVFVGPFTVTMNDERMLWRRKGANKHLQGPTLEYGCRIGGGCVILPGVTVGRESFIAAGSVVNRDIPPKMHAAGNPIRILGPVPAGEELIV